MSGRCGHIFRWAQARGAAETKDTIRCLRTSICHLARISIIRTYPDRFRVFGRFFALDTTVLQLNFGFRRNRNKSNTNAPKTAPTNNCFVFEFLSKFLEIQRNLFLRWLLARHSIASNSHLGFQFAWFWQSEEI